MKSGYVVSHRLTAFILIQKNCLPKPLTTRRRRTDRNIGPLQGGETRGKWERRMRKRLQTAASGGGRGLLSWSSVCSFITGYTWWWVERFHAVGGGGGAEGVGVRGWSLPQAISHVGAARKQQHWQVMRWNYSPSSCIWFTEPAPQPFNAQWSWLVKAAGRNHGERKRKCRRFIRERSISSRKDGDRKKKNDKYGYLSHITGRLSILH